MRKAGCTLPASGTEETAVQDDLSDREGAGRAFGGFKFLSAVGGSEDKKAVAG